VLLSIQLIDTHPVVLITRSAPADLLRQCPKWGMHHSTRF
jgi:hypothetical protein